MSRVPHRRGLLLDLRGLQCDHGDEETMALPALLSLREADVERTAVVTGSGAAVLAFRQLARQTGLYASQRYFCASLTPDWERAATRWVAAGEEEAWPRRGERRAELALLLDALDEALLLCDESGRVLHVNAALERVLEADPERQLLLREMESLARGGGPVRPARVARARRDEREVRTAHGAYRVRRSATIEGLLDPAAASIVALHPIRVQPLTDDALRERFGLTAREIIVARLLAEGHTNAELARRLAISPFTARNHTERVLGKLGVSSRAKVASALTAA